MKIEKLNENQIRCILDKQDLDERELQLSELAYGSTKARELFRDMIERATAEFGFEAENIPLMIEAIPVSMDCLILVVTKVEDPEELDTRFARFSSPMQEEDLEDEDFEDAEEELMGLSDIEEVLSMGGELMEEDREMLEEELEKSSEDPTLEDVFDLMAPFHRAISKAKQELRKKQEEENLRVLSDQIFAFLSLDEVIGACHSIAPFYRGDSVLYKDTAESVYYLHLKQEDMENSMYERACNICSDYGEAILANYGALAYFTEHFQKVLAEDAVGTLHEF